MEKKILLVMPLMAISLFSCGNNKPPFDPSKIDLYTKSYQYESDKTTLKSTTTYTYNKNKLLEQSIEDYEHVSNNQIIKIIKTYEYDNHENVTLDKEERYGNTGKIVDVIEKRYTYSYDTKNRITEIEITGTKEAKRQIEYEYKDKQTIINAYRVTGDKKDLYDRRALTYNDNNQLIDDRDLHINNNTKAYHGLEYSYDEYGCNTYTEIYDVNDDNTRGETTDKINTTYHKNLYYRPLKEVLTIVQTEDQYTKNYTYDDQDRITSYELAYENIPPEKIPYTTYIYE